MALIYQITRNIQSFRGLFFAEMALMTHIYASILNISNLYTQFSDDCPYNLQFFILIDMVIN